MATRGRLPVFAFAPAGTNYAASAPAGAPPLSREALFRRFGPVIGVTLLTLLYAAPGRSGSSDGGPVVQAAFLAAVAAMATVVLPWDRLSPSARAMPAVLYLLVVFLAREAPGEGSVSYSQLVMIPVLWLALYGGFREMAGGLAAAAAAVFVPLLVGVTGPGELRHAVILFGTSSALGVTIQVFFAQLRSHAFGGDDGGTDRLTGAANRRGLEEELERAMAIARRNGRPLSLVMLGLDFFKAYNDRHGHEAGDRLLKQVAARWTTNLRASDTLARVGGDQFALIVQNCPQWAARAIAERLCDIVTMGVTCSGGATAWDGVESAGELVARADRALARAKSEGRNRVVELWSERALANRTPEGEPTA
jgi:diguanylate cyclase (GGDEF)-like protein